MSTYEYENKLMQRFWTIQSFLFCNLVYGLFKICIDQEQARGWAPLFDPHFAQKILQEITIHFYLDTNLLIYSCYNCSLLQLHSDLYHSFPKLIPWYVKGVLEIINRTIQHFPLKSTFFHDNSQCNMKVGYLERNVKHFHVLVSIVVKKTCILCIE